MNALLQIVPKVPGGLDGVGDYALVIARQLRDKFGCETVFASFKTAPSVDGFEVVNLDRLPDASAKFDRVLLHYVNYGFQKRGVPFRLLSILRALRSRHLGKFVTVFHELYASGAPWTSTFWLKPLQKTLAKSVANLSDACVVSSNHSRRELMRMVPHADIALHPVPSSVGEPAIPIAQITNRDPHRWVIFGGTGLVERSVRSFHQLIRRIPDSIAPRNLFVLGGADSPATRSLLSDLKIESDYRPHIPAADVSENLKTCSFAFLDYFHRTDIETSVILKSSAFASACAHAVIPVLPHRGSTVAIDGDPLPGPFFIESDRAEIPGAEGRAKIASDIYDWYHRNAASEILVRRIAEMFQLDLAS